jgi:hypothetical protein
MEISRLAGVDKKFESVTVKVTWYRPETVGVPLRAPFAARWIPGGSVPPVAAQEYGANPPPAESEAAYGTPIVPTVRLVLVTLGGADSVAMAPPEPASVPTASQFTGLAQPTPKREAIPEGADSLTQVVPPLVVCRILAPPTAVHVDELMQLTDSKVVVPAGVPRSLQAEPPFVVPRTWDPVAKQLVSLEHEIPLRRVAVAGGVCGVQVDPPFSVARITPPGPTDDTPTVVQCWASAQEMPVKLVTVPGNGSDTHDSPPLSVARMLGAELPKSLTA